MAEAILVTRRPLGEILIEEGWASASDVSRALADQADLGLRLASLLVSRGLLDPDHAARALGRQHGVPAALLRHLAARDPEVGAWLPADAAHGFTALALATARDGSVVVCVREPDRPELRAALESALRRPVTMVVASEGTLLPLIREVYGPPPDAFEVDMSFGEGGAGEADFDPYASGELDPYASGTFTLANLDDERVVRDPSQAGPRNLGRDLDQPTWLPRTGAPPPAGAAPAVPWPGAAAAAVPRFTPVSGMPALSAKQTPPAGMPARSSPATVPSASQLTAIAVATMTSAARRDQVLDAAFAALTPVWAAAALFSIKDGAALGQRGFGGLLTADAVETLVIPLQSPSLLRSAWQTRELCDGPIAGAVQERLLRLLGGGPACAAPIEVSGRVVGVLLAASPQDEQAPAALRSLARQLGEHFGRLIRAAKRAG